MWIESLGVLVAGVVTSLLVKTDHLYTWHKETKGGVYIATVGLEHPNDRALVIVVNTDLHTKANLHLKLWVLTVAATWSKKTKPTQE